jgi:hypothetical protein
MRVPHMLTSSPRPLQTRIAVCDYCHRVENPHGEWIRLSATEFPPARLILWDICDQCCDRYVQFLLGGRRHNACLS